MLDVQDFRQTLTEDVAFSDFITPVDGAEMPEVNADRLAEYVAGIASDLLNDLIEDLAEQTEQMTSAGAVRDHVIGVLARHADLLERQAWGEA